MNRLCFILSMLCLPGCGSRTPLDVEPDVTDGARPFDAGFDAVVPPDTGPPDTGVPDAGGFMADCGRSEQFTTPRRGITVVATTSGSDRVVEQTWTLDVVEPTSMPRFETGRPPSEATLTPDIVGTYVLGFRAVDDMGRIATCEVTVQSVVGPPVALCPEEMLRTAVDLPIDIVGDGFDDIDVVTFLWEVVDSPSGAGFTLVIPEEPIVTFTADTLGFYTLRLTVTDFDMASDSCEILVQVTGPPVVVCPPDQTVPSRTMVALAATSTDDVGVVSESWEMIALPDASMAALSPTTGPATGFFADKKGDYQVRFTATDVEGFSSSCIVNVIALPTPPVVTCPATIETEPLSTVSITATAVDDGTIVAWSWVATELPAGSSAGDPSPGNAASTNFTPDIAGTYTLVVTARDDDGMTGTCTTLILAGNVDGLRVEMFWNTNGTDMDTHLMNPTGTRWGNGNDDCYFGNCVTGGGPPVLEWGGPGSEDNPRLDIDDTNGEGPENINIETPEPGTYRVAIHNWRGDGMTNQTTVNIYCGGSTTTPRQTFGPVPLRDRPTDGNDFWRVADVTITATGCTITDLSLPDGRPWIERYERTRNMR